MFHGGTVHSTESIDGLKARSRTVHVSAESPGTHSLRVKQAALGTSSVRVRSHKTNRDEFKAPDDLTLVPSTATGAIRRREAASRKGLLGIGIVPTNSSEVVRTLLNPNLMKEANSPCSADLKRAIPM